MKTNDCWVSDKKSKSEKELHQEQWCTPYAASVFLFHPLKIKRNHVSLICLYKYESLPFFPSFHLLNSLSSKG